MTDDCSPHYLYRYDQYLIISASTLVQFTTVLKPGAVEVHLYVYIIICTAPFVVEIPNPPEKRKVRVWNFQLKQTINIILDFHCKCVFLYRPCVLFV